MLAPTPWIEVGSALALAYVTPPPPCLRPPLGLAPQATYHHCAHPWHTCPGKLTLRHSTNITTTTPPPPVHPRDARTELARDRARPPTTMGRVTRAAAPKQRTAAHYTYSCICKSVTGVPCPGPNDRRLAAQVPARIRQGAGLRGWLTTMSGCTAEQAQDAMDVKLTATRLYCYQDHFSEAMNLCECA